MPTPRDRTSRPDAGRAERHAARREGSRRLRAPAERVVVGTDHGLRGSTSPRPVTGPARVTHARPPRASVAPIASAAAPALTSDSATSPAGFESQTTPPPTQRWSEPSAIGEGPDREPSSRSRCREPAERTHRWLARPAELRSDRPPRSSSAVTDPPGNVARRSSARPTSGRSVPSTVETSDDPGDAARPSAPASGHFGRHTRERSFARDRRHHVLARVLLRSPEVVGESSGSVPLMGIVRREFPVAPVNSQATPRRSPSRLPERCRSPPVAAPSRAAIASAAPANGAERCWTN